MELGYNFVWRTTTADAIYARSGVPVAGTAGRSGKYTAGQLALDLSWQVGRHLLVELGYVHVRAAEALRAAGGHDVEFVYASAAYRF